MAEKLTGAERCRWCKGRGTEADYVGLDMRCIEVECSRCKGTGRVLTQTQDAHEE